MAKHKGRFCEWILDATSHYLFAFALIFDWWCINHEVLRPAALWLGLRRLTLNELLRSLGLPPIVVYDR